MKLGDAPAVTATELFSRPCHWVVMASINSLDSEEKFSLLSVAERRRADGFKSKKDKACFIIAHALKRYCLSHLINVDPHSLRFSHSDKGKPFCDSDKTLDFNISHSADWVAFAVSSIASIGVDVERADRVVGKKIMTYALTVEQALILAKAADINQKMMCYWTQKEAVSKALGVGISVGFKNIECSGELGTSFAKCREQQFLIQSCHNDSVMLSMATLAQTPLEVYQLLSWPSSATVEDVAQDPCEASSYRADNTVSEHFVPPETSQTLLLERLL
jgi:4'-phosphopantetheinyl transferase